jgi:hypothetical protein
MRYREINNMGDISRDIAVVVDFIGQKDYRRSLEAIRDALNAKGFVTHIDDAFFALELDLWNVELLREKCSGNFGSLPRKCHAGVDLLIGLGQTIPILSAVAKTRLHGRIRKGLQEGLWPLQHEMRVAANLSKRGWDLYFHDLEHGGGFDFLVTQNGIAFEVEAKAISAFTGWPIKPENLNKLLVEIKQHFAWQNDSEIPLIGVKLSSSLSSDRTKLQELVAGFTKVARDRAPLSLLDASIRFMGVAPNLTFQQLQKATYFHGKTARKIILVNPSRPRVVLELDSERPVQLERKIIRTIGEAAREQFSGSKPGVIWTHINFIPDEVLTHLGLAQGAAASFCDRVASSALFSEKRNHLSQLVFSGGSFLHRTDASAQSSYRTITYDSPNCRFGTNVIFEGGRKKRTRAMA